MNAIQAKRTALLTWRDDLICQTHRNDGAIAVLDELLQETPSLADFDTWLATTRRDAPETLVEDQTVHVPVSAFDADGVPGTIAERYQEFVLARSPSARLPTIRDEEAYKGPL